MTTTRTLNPIAPLRDGETYGQVTVGNVNRGDSQRWAVRTEDGTVSALYSDGTRCQILNTRVVASFVPAAEHTPGCDGLTFLGDPCDGTRCYVPAGRTCDHRVGDGNADDPSFAYCGRPLAHAGDHGDWQF